MGRFSYEKRIPKIGGRGGNKGKRATPKTQFRNTCNGCGGETPCRDSGCRKAAGQASYDARKAPASKAAPKVKKAKLSWGAASKIRKDAKNAYRKAHPSASDSQINRAGRDAVKKAKKRLK